MSVQEVVSGVGTSAGPSWTQHDGNSVWLAWKGEGSDTSIYVANASGPAPNPRTGEYHFGKQAKVLTLATSSSPAIASMGGTLYLFYLSETESQIYWATRDGSAAWIDQHVLSLGDSANEQHPHTIAGPTAISNDDSVLLFWTSTDNQIYWTIYSQGKWLSQQPVVTPAGTPKTDAQPAAALHRDTICLAWKGSGHSSIWSATCPPVGGQLNNSSPWTAQTDGFAGNPDIVTAPALVCDGNGVIWMGWTGHGGAVHNSSMNAQGRWSAPSQRNGIGSSDRPALFSAGGDDTGVMMTWKGNGSDSGIYYGTLPGPIAVRVPITNTVTTGGWYSANAKIDGQAVTLLVDTGSSSLIVESGLKPTGAYAATTLAQLIAYGRGTPEVLGPVIQTTVELDAEGQSPTLEQTNVCVAQPHVSTTDAFHGADGIIGLGYTPLDTASNLEKWLKSEGLKTTYPWPAKLSGASGLTTFKGLPHVTSQTIEPYFTQLEESGVTPDTFSLLVHRSAVSNHSTPTSANPANSGYLIIGGGLDQTDLYGGTPQNVAIADDKFYYVQLDSVQVGDLAPIALKSGAVAAGHPSNALFDSGTAPLLIPKSVREQIVADFGQVNPAFATALTDGLVSGAWMNTQTDWPNLTFTFAGVGNAKVSLILDRDHYWQWDTPAAGSVASMLPDSVPDTSPIILGLAFLSMYYVVFDRSAPGNGVISLANTLLYVA